MWVKEKVMKKILAIAILLLSAQAAFAQSNLMESMLLKRFEAPERGPVTFIEKGSKSYGIKGSYAGYEAGGALDGDGYQILSLLNIGDGYYRTWTVSPRFSYFVGKDLALGGSITYSGYALDTDIKLDLRDMLHSDEADLNLQLSSLNIKNHAGGLDLYLRRYLSFFGSRTFAIFAEADLYGKYGITFTHPRADAEGEIRKQRISQGINVGLQGEVGLAIKLRDRSMFHIGLPLVGVEYSYTKQDKLIDGQDRQAHMSSFRFVRKLDIPRISLSYCRVIEPKRRR